MSHAGGSDRLPKFAFTAARSRLQYQGSSRRPWMSPGLPANAKSERAVKAACGKVFFKVPPDRHGLYPKKTIYRESYSKARNSHPAGLWGKSWHIRRASVMRTQNKL